MYSGLIEYIVQYILEKKKTLQVWPLNEWKIHGQKAGAVEHFSKRGDRGTD